MADLPSDQEFLGATGEEPRRDAEPARATAPRSGEHASLEEEVARLRAYDAARRQPTHPATAGDSERQSGPAQEAELEDAAAVQLELQRRQDRQVLAAALREQENLARMEEIQSQREFEEFLDQVRHEKNIEAAVRQDEVERLWGQIQLRREEERQSLRLMQLTHLKDVARAQAEIEEIRSRIVEMRVRRRALEGEQREREAHAAAAGRLMTRSPGERAAEEVLAAAAADREAMAGAEARLIERMEERLETLVASVDRAREAGAVAAGATAELPRVEAIPRPRFAPERLLLAGKGLYLVEPFPLAPQPRPRRFAPDYDASTRALALGERADGTPRILVSHRAGISELCPDTESLIRHWSLGAASRYAVNAAALLADGALLATHSELGLLRWDAPDREPLRPAPEVRSARGLAATATGWVFADGGRLLACDEAATRVEELGSVGASTITDVAAAEDHVIAGTTEGEVHHLRLGAGGGVTPFLPGTKVYSLALLAWRGEVWVAVGVKRRTGLYVVLHAMSGRSPELSLSVPERPYRLVMPADGRLLALSDHYLCAWDLDVSQQATVMALGAIAPMQDLALLPGA